MPASGSIVTLAVASRESGPNRRRDDSRAMNTDKYESKSHGRDIVDRQPLVVYCTCPDQTVAERIAEALVIERLAACASIVPGLISIYRWQGQVRRDAEFLLIIKTRDVVYSLLEARIRELHPYEVPEILALPIQAGSAAYLGWLADNTGAPV